MKTQIIILVILIVTTSWAQESHLSTKKYFGPFEFIVAPTYSGIDEIGINLDSCVISLQDSQTINISGILIDRSTSERIPGANLAIGIDSSVDKLGMRSRFISLDTSQTDNVGRFKISSRIINSNNATFTFSFNGYFRYYMKLQKIISILSKP
jgi:hypothetical protein